MSAKPDKVKFPRALACQAAREVCDLLRPVTSRLIVAGSLRRGKLEVGDVEILYVPKTEPAQKDGDLFDTWNRDLAIQAIGRAVCGGMLRKRENVKGQTTWGSLIKLAVHVATGVPVDLFEASEANWWNYLVCRTGPAESNMRIAAEALKRGWKWKPYSCGFCLLDHGEETGTFQEVGSERDVFDFVGLPYAEAGERR